LRRTSDAVVVGGGIVGLAVAYFLARAGVGVTLVERGAVGREASWAAAGYLSYQGGSNTPGPRLDLTRTSFEMYEGWVREIGELTPADTGFWRCGLLEIALSEAEAVEARARAAWQRAAGFAVEWLDERAVRGREPGLSAELPVHGALLFPAVAQVRPPRMLKALAEATRRRGVEIREQAPVAAILRDGDRVTGVALAGGETIATPVVVNAAGSWASQLAPEMAVMPVKPMKGTVVLLEVATPPTRELLVSERGSIYPRMDNKVAVGATVEDVGYDTEVRLGSVQKLVSQALAVLPELKDARLAGAWAGLRPYSHDNLPYLGPVPGLRGAYAAAGHYRSGILLAPITGVLLTEMILEKPPTLPLEPFAVARVARSER
jgi:glycine oxidase